MIIVTTSFFEELRFQNVLRPHEIEKPAFSNDVLVFRDGLVWTVALTVALTGVVRTCATPG